jgi:hypothetical protein
MNRTLLTGICRGAFVALTAAIALVVLLHSPMKAATPLPNLFNTGVDGAGAPLPDLADDPHYSIILGPLGGPLADEVTPNDFPVPPWLANSGTSRWITPVDPGHDGNSDPGDFFYETSFDLTGIDPNNWAIAGWHATDNSGTALLLNGTAIPKAVNPGFTTRTWFSVTSNSAQRHAAAVNPVGNTLVFQVFNAPPGINPTGLRTDMYSRGAPLGSTPVTIFNTGVDATGAPLPGGSPDPHYIMAASPVGTVPPGTVLAGAPIPPWVDNTDSSKWIGPNNDAAGQGPPGTYDFVTTFDLTGLVPSSVVITGLWSVDNDTAEIYLNGQATGNPQVGSFPELTPFEISAALGDTFLPGVNTLRFSFVNQPPGNNPAGLRVEALVAYGYPIPEPSTVGMAVLGGLLLLLACRKRAK